MLKPQVIAEIGLALWYLPLDKVDEVQKLVLRLKREHGLPAPVDDSDEWTGQDVRDASRESERRWGELQGADDAASAQAG